MKKLVLSAAVALAVVGLGTGLALANDGGGSKQQPYAALGHAHAGHASAPSISRGFAERLARARVATAKYAVDLERAKADGYMIITKMIPSMGFHFLNPSIQGFDIKRPPILVYEKRGDQWQLGALEWVFPEKPKTDPVPGAKYGSFPAACHYDDGEFIPAESQDECPPTHPKTGARFTFWHPKLITLHIWIWYPNPDGLYSGMNPLVAPFNNG
jgi:hypothetical protein